RNLHINGSHDSHRPRIGPVAIETVLVDGLVDDVGLQFAVIRKRFQSSDGDVVAIHLEELTQLHAIIATAKAVRSEGHVAAWNMAAYPVGVIADVICCRDHGAGMSFECSFDIALAPRLGRMKQVVPINAHAIAAYVIENHSA